MDDFGDVLQAELSCEIGHCVTIEQKDGSSITGELLAVSNKHVTLRTTTGAKKTILIHKIDGWEILPENALPMQVNEYTHSRNGSVVVQNVPEQPAFNHTAFLPDRETEKTVQHPEPHVSLNTQNIVPVSPTSREAPLVSPIVPLPDSPLSAAPLNGVSEKTTLQETVPSAAQQQTADPPKEAVTDAKTSAQSSSDPEVDARLIRVKAKLEGQIEGSKVQILASDFKLPRSEFPKQLYFQTWDKIQQRYLHAVQTNELTGKYGKLSQMIHELGDLIEQLPQLAPLRRRLGYLWYLSDKREEAFYAYQDASFLGAQLEDWHNLGVIALELSRSEDANWAGILDDVYYAWMQFFARVPLDRYRDTWFQFVDVMLQIDEFAPFEHIYDARESLLTEQEVQTLLESAMYLFYEAGDNAIASSLARGMVEQQAASTLLREAIYFIKSVEDSRYRKIQERWDEECKKLQTEVKPASPVPAMPASPPKAANVFSPVVWSTDASRQQSLKSEPLQGHIYTYKKMRNYGFIQGFPSGNFFFHRSAVIDEDLLASLQKLPTEDPLSYRDYIEVSFEVSQGRNGTIAVNVTGKYDVDEVYQRAITYANDGDYTKAINRIRMVLAMKPGYPRAQELYEKWQEFARQLGVPRGSNPYARAKRKQLVEKDLEGAIELFREAIRGGDAVESAVKDLAALLMQLDRPEEAIVVLEQHREKASDQQRMNNLRIDAYQKAGRFNEAVTLLRKMLTQTKAEDKRAVIHGRIATCYLRGGNYTQAEQSFRDVMRRGLTSKATQRNLAFCLIQQKRYDEAAVLLRDNLPDPQSAELLEAIENPETAQIEEIKSELLLADFTNEISGFARFCLDRCTYTGVQPLHVQEKRFTREDVRRLEDLASKLGTRRPRERAEYYLSAAKIIFDMSKSGEWEGEENQLYRYLCRSFASHGDGAIIENKPLDTAREWYCEAVSAYDGDRGRNRDEQDAINALVRFLYATLGRSYVPINVGRPENLRIDDCLEKLLQVPVAHDRDKAFGAISYLVTRSQFAASRVLPRIHDTEIFLGLALSYLKERDIPVTLSAGEISLSQFSDLWKQLQLKEYEKTRSLLIELRSLTRVELTTASVEANLRRWREIERALYFDLEQQRFLELQKILEAMLDLCKQTAFEEKERFCTQIDSRCKDLLRDIETNPTTLSVQGLYPIARAIEEKVTEFLRNLYQSSMPLLSLRIPAGMEYQQPQRRFELQIVIENKMGCSPAESMELVIPEEPALFTLDTSEIIMRGSLRGGEQHIAYVPLQVTEEALRHQAFSLPMYVQYKTRTGDKEEQTPLRSFPINFYSSEQFERIPNPYKVYASGQVVGDETMFYGRSELITNIAEGICNAHGQSKSSIIFGQKRSGKSSILYHLRKRLQQQEDLLVIDIGNIGAFIDEASSVPLLYLILWGILEKFQDAVHEAVEGGRSPLDLSLPSDIEFYKHPTPLRKFQEVLGRFKRVTAKPGDWYGTRLVLLMDEFSYVYELITNKRLSEDFMKNWKALLQENLFSVVLAGQDVMPKFKHHYPNEFGTTQDERVSYLKVEDARKLIDEPIRIGGRNGESRYREKAIDRILALTAGSPYYIQIICDRLVEYMNRKQARLVTEADVEQVKFELLQGANLLGSEYFDNLVSSGDKSPDAILEDDAMKVLKTIADNSRTSSCSRSRIAVETQSPVDVILEDLVNREVLEVKSGQYYEIRVGLFKEWLIARL